MDNGRMTTRIPIRRALISVSDKSGLVEFAKRLDAMGIEIVSSGGTAAALEDADVTVTRVTELTGAPEILGGRVKTLHPKIHGAILADTTVPGHRKDLETEEIEPIELVVVNLYPFEATVAAQTESETDAIEKIDIGGPALVRAAAKNHHRVGVVVDPQQYDEVAAAVEEGGLDADLRRRLAREAFFRTAQYDGAILGWLERGSSLPDHLVIALEKERMLRYGENPHQEAAAYVVPSMASWWAGADHLQGKQMSFNNYLDAEAAWRLVHEFDEPAVTIVKHANPCGLAVGATLPDAFVAAWECDPVSAFGGVVACNRALDQETAQRVASAGFVEVVVAPGVGDGAREVLAGKSNLRLISAVSPSASDPDFRRVEGGFVLQPRDAMSSAEKDRRVVSSRQPTAGEEQDLEFAWKVAAHAKSNAIVVAHDGAAFGIGAGDQSRVSAAERAVARAGDRARGAVAASDAFFPFRDGLDVLANAGVTAIMEPGGSVRDDEVITAADEHAISLVFTGKRHFRH